MNGRTKVLLYISSISNAVTFSCEKVVLIAICHTNTVTL